MDTPFGWMFLGLAVIFSLGLISRLAGKFYPSRPRLLVRLAAPVIFAFIAAACFVGLTMYVLSAVAVLGLVLIVLTRRRAKQPAQPI
jgi:hypothetical protein